MIADGAEPPKLVKPLDTFPAFSLSATIAGFWKNNPPLVISGK